MSLRTLRWTRRALGRLDLIGDQIARDNPAAAAAAINRLASSVGGLASHPALGRPGRIPGTRELVIPGLPYIVAYRVTEATVDILTVMHTAQQWPTRL